MAMLDHLNDCEFAERLDQLYEHLDAALLKVLDEWVKDGIITETDKSAVWDDWENTRGDILTSSLG